MDDYQHYIAHVYLHLIHVVYVPESLCLFNTLGAIYRDRPSLQRDKVCIGISQVDDITMTVITCN